MTDAMLDAALAWAGHHISVLPAQIDGTKAPMNWYGGPKWEQYQNKRSNEATIKHFYAGRPDYPGLGVVTGPISGDLEMTELEGRAVDEGAFERLNPALQAAGLLDLWTMLLDGYAEETPSGGIHIFYRIKDHAAPPNYEIANRLARDEELTDHERELIKELPHKRNEIKRKLAETRGRGGFVIVAPANGTTHENGKAWRAYPGSEYGVVPTIGWAERCDLHRVIKAVLDTMPAKPAPPPRALSTDNTGNRPGDAWAADTTWAEILGAHGWTWVYRHGNEDFWRRPDKSRGVSARTGGDDGDNLWVWSTSTEFPAQETISKLNALAILEHGGDISAAAAALRRQGYGADRPRSSVTFDFEHGTRTPPPPQEEAAGTEAPTEDAETETDSWEPVDLGPYLRGEVPQARATVGVPTSAGLQLLYPGKEHAAVGEMESAKSWFAVASAAYEIGVGRHVVYLHFEDPHPGDTVGRLVALGVAPAQIQDRFHFVGPECRTNVDRLAKLVALAPSLVVLDGQNDAMALHGWGVREEDGAAAYRRVLVRPFIKAGAAVLSLDHVVKDREAQGRYAIGSVMKGNGISGALLLFENAEAFGRGKRGRSHVFVVKDRPGTLREHGRSSRIVGKTLLAELVIDDTRTEFNYLTLTLWSTPPLEDEEAGLDLGGIDADQEAILAAVVALEAEGHVINLRMVRGAVTGMNNARIDLALTRLVLAGRLREEDGKRGAREFSTVPQDQSSESSE